VCGAGPLVELDADAWPIGGFEVAIDHTRDAVEQLARPGCPEVVEALLDEEVRQALKLVGFHA
jgi:hypothetical protein